MARCTCKTQKGVQCKKDAVPGSKTCAIHKKCKSKVTTKKVSTKKMTTKAVAKRMPKKVAKKKSPSPKSPRWVKSKLWDSPNPAWLGTDKKIDVKPMSPQNADPWWLR